MSTDTSSLRAALHLLSSAVVFIVHVPSFCPRDLSTTCLAICHSSTPRFIYPQASFFNALLFPRSRALLWQGPRCSERSWLWPRSCQRCMLERATPRPRWTRTKSWASLRARVKPRSRRCTSASPKNGECFTSTCSSVVGPAR